MEMFKVAALMSEYPPKWEIVTWDIKRVLEEINCNHSDEFINYDETDWREGWEEWVSPQYHIMLQEYESMTHDQVLEACDKHRESQEGVGLSDELIRIVTFAYEQGWYAGCDLGLGPKTLNKERES